MSSHVTLGRQGENMAVSFLRKSGYRILECNFRNNLGEIDIIAKDGHTICFVEVKTRNSAVSGTPFEAVPKRKQAKLVRVGLSFLKNKGLLNKNARFDVIGILKNDESFQIDLIKNAFDLSGIDYH